MSLERLPNEILLELFEYIPVADLFHAFENLNIRLNTLLFNQFDNYRLDFRSMSKRNSNILCQRYLPSITDYVKSLHLSNDDETPDQIHCFLSHNLTFRQFINLQSLWISHLRCEKLMCRLLDECPYFEKLIYLKFTKCEFKHENAAICQSFDNIWRLPKLIYFYSDINLREYGFKDPRRMYLPTVCTSVRYLTLKMHSYEVDHLACIFAHAPYLRYLDVGAMDSTDEKPLNLTVSSLTRLEINVYKSPFILTELLKNMPNLYHLTADVDQMYMDGSQWEQIIVDHLPKLKVFELRMTLPRHASERKRRQVDELLKSFRTRFWLEERRWFVQCEWDRCSEESCHCHNTCLYTVPYAFEYYWFNDSPVKSLSTCPENQMISFYNQVRTIDYEIYPSENQILSHFKFFNLDELYLWLPFDDNFSSIVPQLDCLKILSVSLSDRNSTPDSLQQLQSVLDRAPRLYSLEFARSVSALPGMPPFNCSSKSIRRLVFQDMDRLYDHQQCVTFSQSSLAKQCEVLFIGVKERTDILYLLQTMTKLRALIVASEGDSWPNGDDDELVIWLKRHLPPTYTIGRHEDGIYHGLKLFGYVRIWIS